MLKKDILMLLLLNCKNFSVKDRTNKIVSHVIRLLPLVNLTVFWNTFID